MASDFVTALKAVLERLDALAANDDELRGRLVDLARAFLQAAEVRKPEAPAATPPPPVILPPPQKAESPPAPAPRPPPPVAAPAPPPASMPAVFRPAPVTPTEAGLETVAERCRLKAEAARLVPARLGLPSAPQPPPGADEHDLIARAKALPDCYLWMLHGNSPWADAASYLTLAGCFDTAALAAELLEEFLSTREGARDGFARAAALVAEAQSALRGAVAAVGQRFDTDQVRLFSCLRAATLERQEFITRFMRADDQANPANWPGIRDRIGRLREELREGRERSRRQAKLFGKLRHRTGRVAAAPPGEHEDWSRLVEVVDELVGGGLPPSNLELRECLLPVLENLPESLSLPEGFQRVLRELDRYLASRPAEVAEPSAAADPPSDEVRRAAELLRGRAVVLIGGDRRPHAAEALQTALGLSELVWLEGTPSSYYAFEPFIARPEVAVVLLAIRWSSHGFSEVKEFCDRFGKPLVRLPAGYSPNQVANHVLSQTSGKLAGAGPVKRSAAPGGGVKD